MKDTVQSKRRPGAADPQSRKQHSDASETDASPRDGGVRAGERRSKLHLSLTKRDASLKATPPSRFRK